MSEKQTQAEILLKLGGSPDIRMFRNMVGQAWMGKPSCITRESLILQHPHKVSFGLTPGSGDLIGWRAYVVQPEDVGRTVAIFTSVECKRPRGGVTADNQTQWLTQVRKFGGIACVARSEEEAISGVLDWHPEK